MCFLAKITNKKAFTEEMFNECWRINHDGMWMLIQNKDGTARIYKNMNKEESLKEYIAVQNNEEVSTIIIHFRMWTGWGVNIDNVHPFYITKWIVLFHNWINSDYKPTATECDTALLAKELWKIYKWPFDSFINNQVIKSALHSTYNKYIIATTNNSIIFNENLWHWSEWNWYSNYNYRTYDNFYSNYNYNYNYVAPTKKEEEKTTILFE